MVHFTSAFYILIRPVVVEFGVSGLGRGERRSEKPVTGPFRQVQIRPPTVGVSPVGQPEAGAVRLEGLAGCAPQLLGPYGTGAVAGPYLTELESNPDRVRGLAGWDWIEDTIRRLPASRAFSMSTS